MREKIYDILTLLRGAVDDRKKLHTFVNVSKENLQTPVEGLPALKGLNSLPLHIIMTI